MMNDQATNEIKQEPEQKCPAIPSFDDSPSTSAHNRERSKKKNDDIESFKDRVKTAEKWMIFLTGLIIVVSIFQWDTAKDQSITMQRQLDEMRDGGKQTDALIAQVTEQAKAANQLAKVADASLAESRDHSKRALRPYLLPTIEPGSLVPGEPIKARYYLVNYGQTPALKTYSITGVFVGRKAMKETEKWFADQTTQIYETNAGPPIPPGVPNGRNNEKFILISSRRSITAQDIATIAEQDYSVVIASRHIYRDGFGNTYGTETCHMMTKTWEAAYCPSHNEMY